MSFFTNFSYRLSRGQAVTLNILAVGFIILSIIWFAFEMLKIKLPMEPIVVAFGGLATLFASYWPWKPKYASKRLSNRVSIDFLGNDRKYSFGRDEASFTVEWSNKGGSSIYVQRFGETQVAIADGVSAFGQIKDAGVFDFGSRFVAPNEGQIVVLRNASDRYALLHVHDIKARYHDDDRDEITFSYVINPSGGRDFS